MKSLALLARLAAVTAAMTACIALALPFNADYRVSTISGSSQTPRIAGEAGTNNLHLVWLEATTAPASTIYYARSTNNGTSWETPKAITTDTSTKLFPSVAAASGNVMIVWNTDFNTGGVFYARSTDSGTTFGAPTVLFDAAGYSRNPEVLADSSGHFGVTWYDSANSGGAQVGHIFHALTCDAGTTWSAIQDLTQNDGQVDSETPQLALDSGGTVWLTFRSTRNGEPQGGWPPYQQFLARRLSKTCPSSPGTGGVTFLWPPAPISPGLPDSLTSVYGPTLAAGSGGRIHIAWWDNNAGNNISIRTGTLAGGFTAAQNVSQEGPNNPQIVAGNSDVAGPGVAQDNRSPTPGVNVFWWEETSIVEGFKVGKLKYRESVDGGVTYGAITDLTSSTVTMTPKALYFNGRVHVVWSDYRNAGTSSEIYHKFANEDGSLNNAPAVTFSESAYLFPNTAVGSTSAGHAFTLTNTGGAALTITGIAASAEFGQTNNCPASLASGASCTITGTFTPAASGLRNGSISVTDNASGSPQKITLAGNGGSGCAGDSDGDGVPDCVEPLEGLNPNVKDNDIFTRSRLFAMQQYRDFLGREGDSAGISFWTSQIDSGAASRAQMVENYFNSAEFQGVSAPIARLYFAYFLRIPDYAGLTNWINNYRNGMSLNQVSQAFATSAEFTSRYGSLTNSQFVTLVYNNLFNRAPDSAGLSFWTGQLNSGAIDRGGMMAQFSESAEYKGIIGNSVYVTMIYSGMLRRGPDQAGFNFWVGYMNGGNSGLALIGGFLGSKEYHDRFLPP